MPTSERELNINLMREKHHLQRVRKVATKENAAIDDVLHAIDDELSDINEMLYQKPPLTDDN